MTNDPSTVVADAAAAAARLNETSRHALALARLIRRASPRPRPLVEYRCDAAGGRACTLLQVYGSPDGPFVYHPRYRYSPNEAARQQTPDGRRDYPERAYLLEQLLPPDDVMRVQVQCRHHVLLLNVAPLADDVGRAAPTTIRRFLPDPVVTAKRLR